MPKCPCGTGLSLIDCCGRFIDSGELPSTPEELMRSRYTAFNLCNVDYIKNTMMGPALEGFDKEEVLTWSEAVRWIGLKIINAPKPNISSGEVEFIAKYQIPGFTKVLHELSTFKKVDGKWFYYDGKEITKTESLGRNDLCNCQSGKKYKRCCGSTA